MIGVALGKFEARPELLQTSLETFRRGDAANRADINVAQPFERDQLARQNILEMKRLMRALDDLGRAIVAPDAFDQLVVRLAGAFRNEDVARSSQVPRRLTQRPPRQQVLVTERRLLIDQDDVEAMLEMKVLQSVIQKERVGLELFDREQAAF